MTKSVYLFFTLIFLSASGQIYAQQPSYIDVAGLDRSIKPGDNFFRFVNGRWSDTVKIANDQSGVGSYSFMNIPQKQLLQNILDSVSKAKNLRGSIVDIPLQSTPRFRSKVHHVYRSKEHQHSAGKVTNYSAAKYTTMLKEQCL